MAKPVVIDDGGSTRIRQIKSNVRMDGLLAAPFMDSPDEIFVANANGVLCYLTVRYFAVLGPAHNFPADPGQPLMLGDTVTIDGGNGQSITVTFPIAPNPGQMDIALTPGAGPVVTRKQDNNGIWRYIVTNADNIQTVHYNGALLFNAAATPTIFTMVHFKPS
jgi:hypothetical protein